MAEDRSVRDSQIRPVEVLAECYGSLGWDYGVWESKVHTAPDHFLRIIETMQGFESFAHKKYTSRRVYFPWGDWPWAANGWDNIGAGYHLIASSQMWGCGLSDFKMSEAATTIEGFALYSDQFSGPVTVSGDNCAVIRCRGDLDGHDFQENDEINTELTISADDCLVLFCHGFDVTIEADVNGTVLMGNTETSITDNGSGTQDIGNSSP